MGGGPISEQIQLLFFDAVCNGLKNLDKKSAFLRWWAALKMKESQCPERARVTHPA